MEISPVVAGDVDLVCASAVSVLIVVTVWRLVRFASLTQSHTHTELHQYARRWCMPAVSLVAVVDVARTTHQCQVTVVAAFGIMSIFGLYEMDCWMTS
jgi:hypothetical protein